MTEKPYLINCTFTNEAALYLAYMSFVKGGGLFVRTHLAYFLNELVELSVKLYTDQEPYLVDGKVVWITPKGAQGNKPAGIGVQFIGEHSCYLSNKIETNLAGILHSAQLTDTI